VTEPLTCAVSMVGDAGLISVVGQLNTLSAPLLRAALRKIDAEHPTAVIIDLRQMDMTNDPSLLSLFAPIDQTEGPSGPHLLCGANDQVRAALQASPFTRELPVYRTREAALTAPSNTGIDRVTREIPATRAAPREARQLLTEVCTQWQLTDMVPSAELIISELCANVVVHVGSPMTVILRRTPRSLSIVVRDPDSTPPAPSPAEVAATVPSGRGLRIVEHLADEWGYALTSTGKAIWAVLRRVEPRKAVDAPVQQRGMARGSARTPDGEAVPE
jgi:anti-anti-sigma regulatory factor/anti-sigma regulatory factor (Ser/Thr protein kinase)